MVTAGLLVKCSGFLMQHNYAENALTKLGENLSGMPFRKMKKTNKTKQKPKKKKTTKQNNQKNKPLVRKTILTVISATALFFSLNFIVTLIYYVFKIRYDYFSF